MSGRAQRLANATRLPQTDRRAAVDRDAVLHAGGVSIPVAGDHVIVVDGRELRLTNLDRMLWPEAGFTKADVVAYTLAVAHVLLPHARNRPLTLGRFPGGVDGRGFAQTEMPGVPEWIRTVPLALANGAVKRFTLVDERAALVWLAQMGTIELHAFLGLVADLERPDAVVFDLDPPAPDALLEVAAVACRLRDLLTALGVAPFVKTSGSLGLHVIVPLAGKATYAESRAFATRVAVRLARELPGRVTDRLPRAERRGRTLLDVRQNSRRLTMVLPYSLRAARLPTVSTPVTWDEVEAAVAAADPSLLVFQAADVIERVRSVGDPFASIDAARRPLPAVD